MIDINKEITILRQIPGVGQYLANALSLLQTAGNQLGTHLGADPTQTVPAPAPVQGFTLKSDGAGNVHGVINDNSSIQKGIHYFVEIQQLAVGSPLVFSQPHVIHLGASRTLPPTPLPATDDDGNPVHYIGQAYSQYPGGLPGQEVRFGGTSPTPVVSGGSGRATLLPSTGSGTAQNSGQQSGFGFGRDVFRKQKAG